jgi:uncharacterized protein (TIGR02145 family)
LRFSGKKLKAKNGWYDNNGKIGNGTDEYGFSALPGVCRGCARADYYTSSDDNTSSDRIGYWWTAQAHGKKKGGEIVSFGKGGTYDVKDYRGSGGRSAYARIMYYNKDRVYESKYSKKDGFSVRCLQDQDN